MEVTNKVIEKIEDFAKLQDVLLLFEHALETSEIPTILPTFNDEWIEEQMQTIFDMIKAKNQG